MVGLLRDSEHEDNDAEMGRVAEKKTPSLHLETMESPKHKNTKPHETGHTEVLCPKVGLRESLLERGRKPGVTMLNNK